MDLFYLYCSLKTTCKIVQPHCVGEQFYSKQERLLHYGLFSIRFDVVASVNRIRLRHYGWETLTEESLGEK